MKTLIVLCLSALLLAACDAGMSPTAELNAVAVAERNDAAPGEAVKPAATPEETPASDKDSPVFGIWDSAVYPVMLGQQPELRLPLSFEERWDAADYEMRRVMLESLSKRGSAWAAELIQKLDNGEEHPSILDDSGEKAAAENARLPILRFKLGSSRGGNGCAPMPFGGSMFGPWDTGGGARAP